MMSGILIVALLVFTVSSSHACIFKAQPDLTLQSSTNNGPWSDLKIKETTSACECGKKFGVGPPTWNLFIHVKRNEGNKSMEVLCTGTIISSNLVATSHECVRRPGKTIHIYDAWNVQTLNKGILDKDDLVISTSAASNGGDEFAVEEIIFNQAFIASNKYPENDLLLLKVKADFISRKFYPICLTDNSDLNFLGQVGHYYAVDVDPVLDSTETVDADGIIFTKTMCDNENNTMPGTVNITGPLCLRWSNQLGAEPPHIQSGPLIVKSIHDSRAFFAGLAFNVTSKLTGTGTEYAYFVNMICNKLQVQSMGKYIKYQADKYGSKWCKGPKFELGQSAVAKDGTWPWEQKDFQDSFKERKESLNCVCGVPNTEAGDRIVGGDEAFPYQFGWMAIIKLFHKGKENSASFCGGAIINNRMILTAAHCMIHDDSLRDRRVMPRSYVIKPENIVLTLNAHMREDDEKGLQKDVQAILVHPEYVPGRKRGYYDYDLALLVLKDSLEFPPVTQKGIRPVCLPKLGEVFDLLDKTATVAGWGLTDPEDKYSKAEKLQKIDLPIIDLKKCRDVATDKVTDNFICAGSLNKNKDAARGDSGGPLKIKRGKQFTQVGVVSWGEDVWISELEQEQTAALYTDLTNKNILPFIDYFGKRVQAEWCKSTIKHEK